jgi:hypothetical protein
MGTGGCPTRSYPENRVAYQDIEILVRSVFSVLPVPGEDDHCRARKLPSW